eukprot:scaffold9290_cov107-Cylindrotheca_fusiformis.AAC.7
MNFHFSNCGGLLQPSEDDIRSMDEKVAREMTQLATSEREHALHDLHGVGVEDGETASKAFATARLEQLEEEIQKVKEGTAYTEAEIQCKDYVMNKNFRLMFLRAEDFSARESAARMIRYFDEKRNLFGTGKLARNIQLSDLNKEDKACLRSGFVQILPKKDASGRTVLAYLKGLRSTNQKRIVGRAMWYILSSLIEVESMQTKGVVYIIHHIEAEVRETCLGLAVFAANILYRIMPLKKVGTHLCTDSLEVRPLSTAILNLMKPSDRVRYRCHFGSNKECMYSLRTFGISADLQGKFKLDEHARWFQAQEEKESDHSAAKRDSTSRSTYRNSQVIGPTDVLFGRGAPVRDNPGNARFRKIVDSYILQYETAERLEKGCIAYAIVVMINESNGRFLQRNNDGLWSEVDAIKARDKVHQTFRNVRHQK